MRALRSSSSIVVTMFSTQVTTAMSASTVVCTSVRTNWMNVVLAMIAAHERRTRSRPRTASQPGWMHTTSSGRSSSQTAAIRSRSPASKAA